MKPGSDVVGVVPRLFSETGQPTDLGSLDSSRHGFIGRASKRDLFQTTRRHQRSLHNHPYYLTYDDDRGTDLQCAGKNTRTRGEMQQRDRVSVIERRASVPCL